MASQRIPLTRSRLRAQQANPQYQPTRRVGTRQYVRTHPEEELLLGLEDPRVARPPRRRRRPLVLRAPPPVPERFPFHTILGPQAMDGHVNIATVISDVEETDPRRLNASLFFQAAREQLEQPVGQTFRAIGTLQFSLTMVVELQKEGNRFPFHFRSPNSAGRVFHEQDIHNRMTNAYRNVIQRYENDLPEQDGRRIFGSGSELLKIVSFSVIISPFQMDANVQPGGTFVELPLWIRHKNACINIQNLDDRCLEYCVEVAFTLREHPHLRNLHRYSRWMHKGRVPYLDWDEVDKRLPVYDLCRSIEKMAVLQGKPIRLYVFGYGREPTDPEEGASEEQKRKEEEESIYILYHSMHQQEYQDALSVHLLLTPPPKEEPKGHFVFIKNLNALMNRSGEHQHYCVNCLRGFRKSQSLQEHQESFGCFRHDACKVELPPLSESVAKFDKLRALNPHPFVLYCDFECLISPDARDEHLSVRYKERHVPCGFGITPISRCPDYQPMMVTWRPPSSEPLLTPEGVSVVAEMCVQQIKYMTSQFCKWFAKNGSDFPIPAVDEDTCRYCEQPMHTHDADVCHRRFSFKDANGQLSRNYRIPVYFHNLSGYDGHLILQALRKEIADKTIECICQSGEDLLTFHFGKCQFMDSLAMLRSSLSALVELQINRPSDGSWPALSVLHESFPIYTRHFPSLCHLAQVTPTDDLYRLLLGKGVYPYEYMDTMQRMEETCLPSRESFFSRLRNETVSPDEYEHAQTVWREMQIDTMGAYHDLYLKMDCLLLADVYEQFRNRSIQEFKIDPAHYLSLPGLARDSAFRMIPREYLLPTPERYEQPGPFHPASGKGIALFDATEIDKYLFCESAVRGGICMLPGRFARASPEHQLAYVDANSLYPNAMCEPLPYGEYEWYEPFRDLFPTGCEDPADVLRLWREEIDGYDHQRSTHGMLFEIDYEFPPSTHDFLKDYPPAPARRSLQWEQLSPFSQSYYNEHKLSLDDTEKLICSLLPGTRYIVHVRNLQLYLKLGMVLKKVHRVFRFAHSRWLQTFIQYCAMRRSKATTEFDKEFWKFLMNTVFGKFIENVRKFREVTIVTTPHELFKRTRQPEYIGARVITQDIVMVERKKKKVKLNKAVMVGAVILELSKYHMYSFYYEFMKPVFGHRLRLLMTDTDSLIMHFQSSDYLRELEQFYGRQPFMDRFDFSNLPKDDRFYDPHNKKVVGKFKLELLNIIEFVGLRSKMYSILANERDPSTNFTIKAKGINRSVLKQSLKHEHYIQTLLHQPLPAHLQTMTMHSLRACSGRMYSHAQQKTTLSPADTKLYQVDTIQTLPYGHHDTQNRLQHVYWRKRNRGTSFGQLPPRDSQEDPSPEN